MIQLFEELEQGSEEWLEARRGLLTASEMRLIITPMLKKPADNDKEKSHMYELAAQRITGYVEPHYISDDMLRGHDDEIRAREAYSKKYAPVKKIGFITNDRYGFKIGYSPDGLVEDDGLIECKSRRQKYQIQTIVGKKVPEEYVLQIQTGLLVSERKWCDFITYHGGLPMNTIRMFPDFKIQEAIIRAARLFEEGIVKTIQTYHEVLGSDARLIPTERVIEEQMI